MFKKITVNLVNATLTKYVFQKTRILSAFVRFLVENMHVCCMVFYLGVERAKPECFVETWGRSQAEPKWFLENEVKFCLSIFSVKNSKIHFFLHFLL